MKNKESIDLLPALASPLPMIVMCEMIGIDDPDIQKSISQWSNDIVDSMEIDIPMSVRERAFCSTMAFAKYLVYLIKERQNNLQKDPLSALIKSYQQKQISAEELLANGMLLLFAGIVTTQNLLGNGLFTLLNHPQQLKKLQEEPELISSAIEECLRYEPPAQFTIRYAHDDVVFKDKVIKKNQRLYLVLAAANRDPKIFSKPEQFDITRTPNNHMSFGLGSHFCSGAYLARMEAEIAINTILKHFSDLRLTQSLPTWKKGLRKRGLQSLVVDH
jgi:pimeloyl-[acyl-carrier protein] synthase